MMRKSRTSVLVAAALLLGSVGACGNQPTTPAAQPPTTPTSAAAPSPTTTSAAPATTDPTRPPTESTTAPEPPPAAGVFPLTVSRRGGFAGVNDRVAIKADGTTLVTRDGQQTTRTTLPAATMSELRRLLTAPDFPRREKSSAVCSDGFEYEISTASTTAVMEDCGPAQETSIDKVVAIVQRLLNG
ncbi:hypothetical protein [Actinoplanes sp. NPDC051859]|uniref:hypothetical protein n=1 Tax=Actinoplanes sp. NPDC051859 TaxID=3363909 RepID=UPI00379550DF